MLPTMIPKRGAFALGLTAVGLALLLSFKTPTDDSAASVGDLRGAGSASGGTARGTSGGTSSTGGTVPGGTDAADAGSGSGSAGTGSGGTGAGSGSGSAGAGGGSGAGKTVDGPTVDTRYGPVQVEITLSSGKVTDIEALQLPNRDRRSASISGRAAPVLRSEALTAQSANIDGVSGATYTSDAYARSLQAALDSAGI
jgi:FMN-binding domain